MMHSKTSAVHICFYDFSIRTAKNQGNSEIILSLRIAASKKQRRAISPSLPENGHEPHKSEEAAKYSSAPLKCSVYFFSDTSEITQFAQKPDFSMGTPIASLIRSEN